MVRDMSSAWGFTGAEEFKWEHITARVPTLADLRSLAALYVQQLSTGEENGNGRYWEECDSILQLSWFITEEKPPPLLCFIPVICLPQSVQSLVAGILKYRWHRLRQNIKAASLLSISPTPYRQISLLAKCLFHLYCLQAYAMSCVIIQRDLPYYDTWLFFSKGQKHLPGQVMQHDSDQHLFLTSGVKVSQCCHTWICQSNASLMETEGSVIVE